MINFILWFEGLWYIKTSSILRTSISRALISRSLMYRPSISRSSISMAKIWIIDFFVCYSLSQSSSFYSWNWAWSPRKAIIKVWELPNGSIKNRTCFISQHQQIGPLGSIWILKPEGSNAAESSSLAIYQLYGSIIAQWQE